MGISEARAYLCGVGYEPTQGESMSGLLDRAASDAIKSGLTAEMAARAIDTLLTGRRMNPSLRAFGEVLATEVTPPIVEEVLPVVSVPIHTELVLINTEELRTVDTEDVTEELPDTTIVPKPIAYDTRKRLCERDDAFMTGKNQRIFAQTVCRMCPVNVECAIDGLEGREQYGVWGGLTERQRRKLESRGSIAVENVLGILRDHLANREAAS